MLLVSAIAGGTPIRADETELAKTTSLGIVPQDASYYVSYLRNREQFELLTNSRIFQRVMQSPDVRMLLDLMSAPAAPGAFGAAEVGPLDEAIPASQPKPIAIPGWDLVPPVTRNVIIDALSHEVFFYAGNTAPGMVDFYVELEQELWQFPRTGAANGNSIEVPAQNADEYRRQYGRLVEKHADNLRMPTLLAGFKLTDADAARTQLDLIESLARMAGQTLQPPMDQQEIRRANFGGGDFVIVHLDPERLTSLVSDQFAESLTPETVKVLSQRNVYVAIGVLGEYIVASLSESTKHLDEWGTVASLAAHPQLQPLRESSDKKLTMVSYTNDNMADSLVASSGTFRALVNGVRSFLTIGVGDSKAELLAQAHSEFGELIKQWQALNGKARSQLGFTYLTEDGFEGFSYDRSELRTIDASRPLDILNHIGGKPIGFYASRQAKTIERYNLLAKTSERAIHYLDEIVLLPPESQKTGPRYERMNKSCLEFDRTMREELLPALSDGQLAIAIDAHLESQKLHDSLPTVETPLQSPTLAFVCGVSDPEKLRLSGQNLRLAIQGILGMYPSDESQNVIETVTMPEGQFYFLRIPEAGFDAQVAPNFGMSDKYLVASAVPKVSRRMLQTHPLTVSREPDGPSLFNNIKRPLASAAYLNVAGLVDVLAPWLRESLVAKLSTPDPFTDSPISDDELQGLKELNGQRFDLVADVIRTFRNYASVSYREGETLVTHYQWKFADSPQP